eukprot:1145269-Pelagomonas_calceolata.AAC.2
MNFTEVSFIKTTCLLNLFHSLLNTQSLAMWQDIQEMKKAQGTGAPRHRHGTAVCPALFTYPRFH